MNEQTPENQTPVNQTQFSFEEPIFQDAQVYVDETLPLEEKPNNKKKFLIIGIGVFVFILILLVIVITLIKGKGKEVEPEALKREIEASKELDPIEERVEDARVLLDLADPTKQDLSFPPVDLKIRLDKKEK